MVGVFKIKTGRCLGGVERIYVIEPGRAALFSGAVCALHTQPRGPVETAAHPKLHSLSHTLVQSHLLTKLFVSGAAFSEKDYLLLIFNEDAIQSSVSCTVRAHGR